MHNSVTTLRGVGEKLRLRLSEIGIDSLEDLLFHFPLRYQDRTRVTPIGALTDQIDAVVQGDIKGAAVTMGRRRTLVVKISDDTGFITFGKRRWLSLKPGVASPFLEHRGD